MITIHEINSKAAEAHLAGHMEGAVVEAVQV